MSDDQEDKTVIANVPSILMDTPKRKGAPSLVQYSGTSLGKRYSLAQATTKIGRSAEADITIPDGSVSRVHALLSNNDNEADVEIEIEDAGSANGTYINDQRVQARTPLKDQDMVRLGTVLFKFFSGDNIEGFVHDKIYQMATIDAGTQMFNKQYLIDSLESEFKRAQSSSRPLSIIYYDLDFFKKVNDTYGHNAGDAVLREGAIITKKLIRKDDILCRYGGEEFVIILPNTDIKDAYELAERIRAGMEAYVFKLENEVNGISQIVNHKQTVSSGVSQLDATMAQPKDLLESADKKLYTSKQTGRNRVTA